MKTPLEVYDAHNHLQDPRLKPFTCYNSEWSKDSELSGAVVNGISPDEWAEVRRLCKHQPAFYAAYGVHPWCVMNLPENWENSLRQYLATGAVSVGEIGLDQWVKNTDYSLQESVFRKQLAIARENCLPPSIHCLRAWGWLERVLSEEGIPDRGFLLHGYGGSPEMVEQMTALGAYFSFSAYIADPRRKRAQEAVRVVPEDRILVETDAPSMAPPESRANYPLQDSETGEPLHHPNEIKTAYRVIADLRGVDVGNLSRQVKENFHRLFLEG